jgi:hypothetical protein
MLLILSIIIAGTIFTFLFALGNMLIMSAVDWLDTKPALSNTFTLLSFIPGINMILTLVLYVCVFLQTRKEKRDTATISCNHIE